MHDYMNQYFDPYEYPPPSTHIYNLPVQSFKMVMQSISMHIACYHLEEKQTFNNRAISTSAIESCFSNLGVVELSGSGCPKAYQIPKLMSILVEYNIAKHDPTKIFTMDKRCSAPYPVHLADEFSSSESDGELNSSQNTFHEHSFDRIPRFGCKHKKINPTIYGPRQSSQEDIGVHIKGHFHFNEAIIGALTRSGLPEDFNVNNHSFQKLYHIF